MIKTLGILVAVVFAIVTPTAGEARPGGTDCEAARKAVQAEITAACPCDGPSAHTDYVGAAKRNRIANNGNPFYAYRLHEFAPRPGDLVCVERQDGNGVWSGVNYDNVDQGFRASHCDVVVEVQQGKLLTIGGNVSDSVSQSTVTIDNTGHVIQSRYYAVVRVGA